MTNHVPIDWEARCRALYEESVAALDGRTRSRLTAARHAALDAGMRARADARRSVPRWSWAVAGVAAALLIAVALWVAMPIGGSSAVTGVGVSRTEDAALVASTGAADDPVEMMRDDADFYTWAAGVSAPAERDQAD